MSAGAKHTPGPWGRIGATVFKLTEYTGDSPTMKHALKDGINRFTCRVDQDNLEHCGGAGPAEIEANARLIAAAPDLLVALQNLVGQCEQEPGWHQTPAIQLARRAIAKTEGRIE